MMQYLLTKYYHKDKKISTVEAKIKPQIIADKM